jgi:hypothetical protein
MLHINLITVIEGEALALLEATSEATSRGWPNIIFESDSKTVVNIVHTNQSGNSEFNSIIFFIVIELKLIMNDNQT